MITDSMVFCLLTPYLMRFLKKKKHLPLPILYYQDILPSKTLHYQTFSALTKHYQDILQHFVVVMVIVMLVLVLYIPGLALVPSYGSQNTCTASTAVDGK